MKPISYIMVNTITFYRLAAAGALVILLFSAQSALFKWLLALSFFTDAVDGWLARKFGVVSLLGARIDSIADDLTVAVSILGIIIYHPDFLVLHGLLIATLVIFYLVQNSIALIRFRRLTSFHTYAAKVAAVFQGIFLVLFYFLPEPIPILFYSAAFFTLLELAEEILLALLLPKWEADVKGLYWLLKRK